MIKYIGVRRVRFLAVKRDRLERLCFQTVNRSIFVRSDSKLVVVSLNYSFLTLSSGALKAMIQSNLYLKKTDGKLGREEVI